VQKETAQTDIKDRFLQVYDLSKQNYELEKVLQNLSKLEVIEQMVNILTERGLQMAQWSTFKQNLGYIGHKTE
jgi:hypothetical protein